MKLVFLFPFVTVYKLLDELGGYIRPNSEGPSDVTPLISSLLRIAGAPLFDLYVDADLYDHTKMAVFLDLPKKSQSDILVSEFSVSWCLLHVLCLNDLHASPAITRIIIITNFHITVINIENS